MRVGYVLDVKTEIEDQAFFSTNFLPLVHFEAPGLHKLRLKEERSDFSLKFLASKTFLAIFHSLFHQQHSNNTKRFHFLDNFEKQLFNAIDSLSQHIAYHTKQLTALGLFSSLEHSDI